MDRPSSERRRALVVMGMHRSGTSAMARLLSLAGAELPRNLMAAQSDNPEGFWEPADIVDFNDRLLEAVDSEWDDVFGGVAKRYLSNVEGRFLAEAVELLDANYGDAPIIVMKDPRVSVLNGFWKRALEKAGYDPHYVIMVRHPLEVAASLSERNRFPREKSVMLWANYMVAAERDTREASRTFVAFDAVQRDWRKALDRIEAQSGIVLPRRTAAASVESDRHVKSSLRHHAEGEVDEGVVGWPSVKPLYEWFLAAAEDRASETDVPRQVETEFIALDRLLGPVVADLKMERKAAEADFREQLKTQAEEAEAERERLAERLDQIVAELADSQAGRQASQDEAAALANERERLRGEIARVEDRLRAAEAEAAEDRQAFETERAALASERQGLSALVIDLKARLAEAQAQRDSEAAALAASRDAAEAQAARSGAALAEAEAETARLGAALAEAEAETARLSAALADAEDQRRAIEDQVRAVEEARAAERQAAEAQRARLVEQLERAEAEREQLDALVLAGERRLAEAAAELNRFTATVPDLERRLADREGEIAGLKVEAERAAGLDQALADAQAGLARMQAELAESQALAEQGARDRLDLDHARDALHAAEVRRDQVAREHEAALAALRRELDGERQAAADTLRLAQRDRANLEAALADRSTALRNAENARQALAVEREQIQASMTWRISAPVRRFLSGRPGLARLVRRTVKAVYWTATLQLPARLADRKRMLALAAAHQAEVATPPRPAEPVAAPPTTVHSQAPAPAPRAALVAPDLPPLVETGQLMETLRVQYGRTADVEWVPALMGRYQLPFTADREIMKRGRSDETVDGLVASLKAAAAHWTAVESPDVSIVIPVYNQVAFTLAAIEAIARAPVKRSFEIIIADDGSTDQTQKVFAAGLPRCVYVRQPTNLGFIRNCNAAAKVAKGQVVVMLNNDTIPLPGWLDELCDTLEEPGVGIAGSKLLYPDGRLQEDGGIVWRDLSAWNYGRFDDPHRPRYSYRRVADYVSGAAIAIKADLWRRFGGFSEELEVAYGEDLELSLRVKEAGYDTVVQPVSQVIHFEGVSSGTDTNEGVKAYQVSNLRKLARTWEPKLAHHRANAVLPELEKERSVRGKVLFIDHCTPEPDKDAGSVTAYGMMLAYLDKGYKVAFVPEDNFLYMPDYSRALQRKGIEAIYFPYYRSVEEYLAEVGDQFEAVLIFRMGAASRHTDTVRRYCPSAKILFQTMDLHFLREQRQAQIENSPRIAAQAEQTKQTELAAIDKVDVTIIHSTLEIELVRQERPDAKFFLYPLAIDPVGRGPGFAARKDIIFLGGYRHTPNVDAVEWFVGEIWPKVRAAVPDARFIVAGSEAPPAIRALDGKDNIRFAGFIPDLDGPFKEVKLSIAPLRYGAGIKGKIGTSLSYGVPCVATPIAAEGMGLTDGDNILVAESAEDFAAAVIRAYTDEALWNRLNAGGVDFVDQNYALRHGPRLVDEMMELARR